MVFQRYAANYTKMTSNKQCSFFEPCWLFSLRFGWHLPSYDIDDTWYKNQKNANRVVLDCNGQPCMWKKCQPKSTCRFLNLSRDKNQIKCVPTCFGVKPNFSFKFHLHISQCNGLMLAENSKLCYSNSICSSVLFFFRPNSGSNQVFGGFTLHKSHFKKSRKKIVFEMEAIHLIWAVMNFSGVK